MLQFTNKGNHNMSHREYVYRSVLSAEDIKEDIKEINEYGKKAYMALGKCFSLKYFFVRDKRYKKTPGLLTNDWSLQKVYDALPKLQRDVMVNKNYCSKMWVEEREEGIYLEMEINPIELYSTFSTKAVLYKRKCTTPIEMKEIISYFNLDYYKALRSYDLAYKLRKNLDNGIPTFQMGFRDLTSEQEQEIAGTQITRYCEESNVSKIEWEVSNTEYIKNYIRSDKAQEFKSVVYRDDWESTWFNVIEDTDERSLISDLEKKWWNNQV
jgi:hypothetical protein